MNMNYSRTLSRLTTTLAIPLFCALLSAGCGETASLQTSQQPLSSVKLPLDNSGIAPVHAELSRSASMTMLADLITPDTFLALTVAPQEAGKLWDSIAKLIGFTSGPENVERVTMLVANPSDFSVPALTGSRTTATSDTALVWQFDTKEAADKFADDLVFVKGEYPIPIHFVAGSSGDGVTPELRTKRIHWDFYGSQLWHFIPSSDVAVFRADETTLAIGSRRLVKQMGTRREFLPLRKQVLNAPETDFAGAFINFANVTGWIDDLQRDETQWGNSGLNRFRTDHEEPPIWHAAVLNRIRDVSIGWKHGGDDPLLMEMTIWPHTWLDSKTSAALREDYITRLHEAVATYGSQLVSRGISKKLPPLFKAVDQPAVSQGAVKWRFSSDERLVARIKLLAGSAGTAAASNRLKQIGISLYNYHEVHSRFPAAVWSRSTGGRSFLSWRVAILPFLGESDLYSRFHLDEAWDSPHNIKLLSEMPDAYAAPSQSPETGHTTTLVVSAAGAAFDPHSVVVNATPRGILANGIRLSDITDGAASVAGLIVAGKDKAVPWTKPEDLTVDLSEDSPPGRSPLLRSLGETASKPCLVGLMDGSTVTIPAHWPEDSWRRLLLRNGGRELPELESLK